MAKLSTLDFFKILYTITRNYPQTFYSESANIQKELTHKRTNTFAVVYKQSQINADNIEKDTRYKDKDLFYSRHWEELQQHPSEIKFYYPALLVAEGATTFEKAFDQGYDERIVFNLMLFDKMPDKQVDMSNEYPGKMRTFEEIGEDLKEIMQNIMFQLADYSYFTITDNLSNTFEGWYPTSWVEAKKASGDFVSYNTLGNLIDHLGDGVSASKIFSAFSDDLVGYFANVNVTMLSCDKKEFTYPNLTTGINSVPDSSV
jgi:hypothetical protein